MKKASAQSGTPLLLTCRDVQKLCQVGRHKALDLIHASGPVRVGGSLRVRRQDLEALLARLAGKES